MANISATGLARLIDQISRNTFNNAFHRNLNPAQWQCLRYFERAGHRGRTVSEFAMAQGTTKGTASRTVSALIGKGYLVKETNPRDARSNLVRLTSDGAELLKDDPLDRLAEVLERLESDQQEALAESLSRVLVDMSGEPAE
ncbi:MAG: MarR family winged helix-turn-helix transcriptional regulator [Magnetovibrionaceae bacterium]